MKRAILSSFAVIAAGIAVTASSLISPSTATAATYVSNSSGTYVTNPNGIYVANTNGTSASVSVSGAGASVTTARATTTTAAAAGACGDPKGFGESIRARHANFVGGVKTIHKVVGDVCIEVYIGKTNEEYEPVIWGGNCVPLNNKPARAVSAKLSYYAANHRVADVESEKNRKLWIPGTYQLHNETDQPDSIYSKTSSARIENALSKNVGDSDAFKDADTGAELNENNTTGGAKGLRVSLTCSSGGGAFNYLFNRKSVTSATIVSPLLEYSR